MDAMARPSKTPVSTGFSFDQARNARETSAIGMRSQLIVAARIMVGAKTIMAARHGSFGLVSAVAITVTTKGMNNRMTLTSKNARYPSG